MLAQILKKKKKKIKVKVLQSPNQIPKLSSKYILYKTSNKTVMGGKKILTERFLAMPS